MSDLLTDRLSFTIEGMTTNSTDADRLRERLAAKINEVPYERPAPREGLSHLTFYATDLDLTTHFYADMLGFSVVHVEPVASDPTATQVFVDVGGGSQLVFCDLPAGEPLEAEREGTVHHVAICVTTERLDDLVSRMVSEGVPYTGPIRKRYASLYVRDPNGVLIEFLSGARLRKGE